MIRHFVLFSVPPEVSTDELAAILGEARQLPLEISEVRNFHLGKTFGAVMPPRWEYCMSMEFDDEASLQRYVRHPVHVAFRDLFRGRIHDRVTHTVQAMTTPAG